jgi:uncharacterized protein (DUF1810 family)
MTLFSQVTNKSPLFDRALDKYFNGECDNKTLEPLDYLGK